MVTLGDRTLTQEFWMDIIQFIRIIMFLRFVEVTIYYNQLVCHADKSLSQLNNLNLLRTYKTD